MNRDAAFGTAFPDMVFDLNPIPMWVYDAETLRFLNINDAALAAYGYSREEFLALTLPEIRPPAERLDRRPAGRWKHLRADRTLVDVEVASSLPFVHQGRPAVLAVVFDITKQNVRMRSLEAYRLALLEAQEIGDLGGFIFDVELGVFRLGGALARAYGREEIPLDEVAAEIERVWSEDDAPEGQRLLRSLERFEPYNGEFRLRVDGAVRWFHGRTNILRGPDGAPSGTIGVAIDITDRIAEAERLRSLAFTDPSTGLPNRAALDQVAQTDFTAAGLILVRVTWVAETAHRSQEARIRTDRAVASTLQALAPEDARLFRYSDQIFAILTKRTQRLRAPVPLAKRIAAAFERPVSAGFDEFVVIPTIGVAAVTGPESTVADLALRAEAALHEAQRAPDRIALYTPELERVHDRRAAIERNLRQAIADERVGVVYQPIVSLATGLVVAAEALMRWDCPGIGPVPPAEFIAIAEDSGVILRLGEWIIRTACFEARRWQLEGVGDLRIAINVSARQVEQRDFVRLIVAASEAAELRPTEIQLEITERIVTHDEGLALRNLEALRRLGVRIAIDDFGTGHSSLRYLGTLPLDVVKLDRTFIAAVGEDPWHADIASSVITLARRRGLTVVGEGVETAVQREWLRKNGCSEAQGFLFGAPGTSDELLEACRRLRAAAGAP